MPHEIVDAFATEGLTLRKTLREMLNEAPHHRTVRRGCGLTQSTRLLSEYINRDRDPIAPDDLSLFGEFSSRQVKAIATRSIANGWPHGWRELHLAPSSTQNAIADLAGATDLIALSALLERVQQQLERHESQLVMALIKGILSNGAELSPTLPYMAEKPDIGSCSQAEEFFLEIAHGKIRRGGYINILVDNTNRPIGVEKMHLGESFSTCFIEPVCLGGVELPPGSLAALSHHNEPQTPLPDSKWQTLPLTDIKAARFLRLTTLCVAPDIRERAFSSQFRRQVVGNMLSPASTTLDDLAAFASQRVEPL